MPNEHGKGPARVASRTVRVRGVRAAPAGCRQCQELSASPATAGAMAPEARAAHLERHLREEARRQRSA